MNELRRTPQFETWIAGLKDEAAQARIETRIMRMSFGLFGDVKPVGGGVSELRIDCGPGYRVYFCRQGRALILLLAGGSKHTQARDIRLALKLAENL